MTAPDPWANLTPAKAITVLDLFSAVAGGWSLGLHRAGFRTIAACAPDRAGSVLDVACGPGILACALAKRAERVVGIDITPAMIEQARVRQEAVALHNCEWHLGDAAALPFADGAFDLVTTRYSFHHMPDPGTALAEMKRVCRAGSLSGRIGLDYGDMTLVEGGISAQTRRCLANIGEVLLLAGSSLERVVKTTVFLATMTDFAAMNEVYAGTFGDRRPARSTFAVAGLPMGALIEIEVVAGA